MAGQISNPVDRVPVGCGLAADAGRRGDHRRSRRPVLRRSGARRAGRRLRKRSAAPWRPRAGQRRGYSAGPDDAAAPPAGLDVPRRADLVRAQAVRLALAGEQQGDEPEQLYRPDGPQLRGPADAGGPGACPVRQHRVAGDSRRGLPADPGRRQHHPARVLPAARLRHDPAGQRATGRDPDPLLGLPRLGDPDGTALRGHHRSPAHRPPGDELLRVDLLGRCERRHPQARAGRHRRRWNIRAATRSAGMSWTAPSSRTPNPASTSPSMGGGC